MIVRAVLAVAMLLVTTCAPAVAEGNPGAAADDDAFIVTAEEYATGLPTLGDVATTSETTYEWRPACPRDSTSPDGYLIPCTQLFGCVGGGLPWELRAQIEGAWHRVSWECRGGTPSPTLTPAAVATAFHRIPLPELRSIAQPNTKTLVNFETIFHVEAETLDRTVMLLGQRVELTITPTRFRWDFGDGSTEVTTTPGHAYPSKSVTHRYASAPLTVSHRVTVIWTATWRVGGGPWRDVPGTVTTVGPGTALRVAEAIPLLAAGDD